MGCRQLCIKKFSCEYFLPCFFWGNKSSYQLKHLLSLWSKYDSQLVFFKFPCFTTLWSHSECLLTWWITTILYSLYQIESKLKFKFEILYNIDLYPYNRNVSDVLYKRFSLSLNECISNNEICIHMKECQNLCNEKSLFANENWVIVSLMSNFSSLSIGH